MTTIAFDGTTLAADSLCHAGGMRLGAVTKLWRMPDGRLFAGCGDTAIVELVRQWLENGQDPARRPTILHEQGFNGLLITPAQPRQNRTPPLIHQLDEHLAPMDIASPFYALGSGREYAVAAMAAGASAAAAVDIAIRFDVYSGPPVQSIVLCVAHARHTARREHAPTRQPIAARGPRRG